MSPPPRPLIGILPAETDDAVAFVRPREHVVARSSDDDGQAALLAEGDRIGGNHGLEDFGRLLPGLVARS